MTDDKKVAGRSRAVAPLDFSPSNAPAAGADLMIMMGKGRVPVDDLVHLPVGYRLDSGGRTRALCICGVGGKSGHENEADALDALEREHGVTQPICCLCLRYRAYDESSKDRWDALMIVIDAETGLEQLVCADMNGACEYFAARHRAAHMRRGPRWREVVEQILGSSVAGVVLFYLAFTAGLLNGPSGGQVANIIAGLLLVVAYFVLAFLGADSDDMSPRQARAERIMTLLLFALLSGAFGLFAWSHWR